MVKVLFIAGPARSGSTLLGRMLAHLDGFVCVGELRLIWHQGFAKNLACGCGKPFRKCEFWREVVREAFGGYKQVGDEFQSLGQMIVRPGKDVEARPQGHPLDRPHYIPQIVFRPEMPGYGRALKSYQERLLSLYQAIHRVSGADYIIDTSKEPSTAFLLSTLPQTELHIVHLVRDSRAVAFSHLRKKIRPEIGSRTVFMTRWNPLESAVGWLYRNLATEALKWVMGDPLRRFTDVRAGISYVRVRYEDMVVDPDEAVSRILDPLGVTCRATDSIVRDGKVRLGVDHTVWGNPMRFQQGEIDLRPDLDWQSAMRARDELVVRLITLPLLRRYGYAAKPGPQGSSTG